MNFVFVPAAHICISIYLYGIGLFTLTTLLVYLRFQVVIPGRYRLFGVIKSSFKALAPVLYVPILVAIFASFALGSIGKLIYIGIIWLCSLSWYIGTFSILMTDLEVIKSKAQYPIWSN